MQRLVEVADQVHEQPDRLGVQEIDLVLWRRRWRPRLRSDRAAQLPHRVGDHLHDVVVAGPGLAQLIGRLLQRHVGEVVAVMMLVAIGIALLFVGWRPAAERYVVSLGAVGKHRHLAEAARLTGPVEQRMHPLVRLPVVLFENQIGDGADDPMSRVVPADRRCRRDDRHQPAKGGGVKLARHCLVSHTLLSRCVHLAAFAIPREATRVAPSAQSAAAAI
jgi:hypothetical protein